MSTYIDAINGMKGGPMAGNGASPGFGAPPDFKGLVPPPPTMTGRMPTGAPGTTKKVAADDAISALRGFQGWVPEMTNDINDFINRIKQAASDKPGENAGPALGEPGPQGAAQGGASPLMQSGSPGSM